jgi:limonene-1,2-epoxide hydrolase
MPDSNVQIYERILDAFNRDGVEGSMRYFADDAEVYDPDVPDSPYKGRDAVAAFLAQLIEGADRVEVRAARLLPAGDRVVGLLHTHWRRGGADPQMELIDAHTLTFRDGKVVYWRAYLHPREALSDAGLDPDQLDEIKPST